MIESPKNAPLEPGPVPRCVLGAAGSAPPMTFEYNGCQYIVVNATGGRFFGFKKNFDTTVAYKLNTCKLLSKK